MTRASDREDRQLDRNILMKLDLLEREVTSLAMGVAVIGQLSADTNARLVQMAPQGSVVINVGPTSEI